MREILTSEEKLKSSVFVVEATSYEQHSLWKESHEEVSWEEDCQGFWQIVGRIKRKKEKMPVALSVSFAKIYGQRVAFYEATSQVVDHSMVKDWIMKEVNPPRWSNDTRVSHCDAWNFGSCIQACKEILKTQEENTLEAWKDIISNTKVW